MSVPIENGRNQKGLIKDVRIGNNENWQMTHWRTLTACYNNSPYFEYYRDWLQMFFTEKWNFLFEMNLHILSWLKQVLKFPAEIIIIENISDLSETQLIDKRYEWVPKNFQQNTLVVTYPQVFQERIGFRPNLSILDLLFNIGPETTDFLRRLSLPD